MLSIRSLAASVRAANWRAVPAVQQTAQSSACTAVRLSAQPSASSGFSKVSPMPIQLSQPAEKTSEKPTAVDHATPTSRVPQRRRVPARRATTNATTRQPSRIGQVVESAPGSRTSCRSGTARTRARATDGRALLRPIARATGPRRTANASAAPGAASLPISAVIQNAANSAASSGASATRSGRERRGVDMASP
ncbi:hypothetical protein B0T42_18985 [Rathayibacter sp. VKM Ac-2630]|nr:hypothetical protein B0T42_18985 [Rathayibacter sp. VKM Ac-2630]